jgi:hypothetical protein
MRECQPIVPTSIHFIECHSIKRSVSNVSQSFVRKNGRERAGLQMADITNDLDMYSNSIVMSRYQNVGQNHDIKIANRSFENVVQ